MFTKILFLFSAILIHQVSCSSDHMNQEVSDEKESIKFVGRMLEQGRTLVHHTVKRFMIILPAIFFKLGIAFTLLVLVTIVAINNGFIGFLLLVVGLSSVLARLQEARRPAAASFPYISALPSYYHHGHNLHGWDRSDNTPEKTVTLDGSTQYSPSYQHYKPYSSAYSTYSQKNFRKEKSKKDL
ncbi:uncharacterized protein LOC115891298 [Sitophilus oryzae]|uniref:Uncharacterized protein LOC115891298 n=1 Tax=Sitophilus oryzae TaxID=7048 RepID=A0A6J2YWF0_SITOR|nr:uncharacterized protein LOC115891298 [Sitophilus oryzae]